MDNEIGQQDSESTSYINVQSNLHFQQFSVFFKWAIGLGANVACLLAGVTLGRLEPTQDI